MVLRIAAVLAAALAGLLAIPERSRTDHLVDAAAAPLTVSATPGLSAATPLQETPVAVAVARPAAAPLALTERIARPGHFGLASYYSPRLAGRTMADGTPLRLDSDSAASRTLPLGTVARVHNLANGRSALVTIRDRGPFVKGRIIDVSPATARHLGMLQRGVVKVAVTPLQPEERAAEQLASTVVALSMPSDERPRRKAF